MRSVQFDAQQTGEDRAVVNGIEYKKGEKVRLKLGKRRSDSSDLLLDGKVATIETIYRDYDDSVYIAVTMDDDPGQDMQRDLGRYLFFFPDEVEVTKSKE
ncbi:MAG: hypothetical protein ACREOI_21055 [bacterium]